MPRHPASVQIAAFKGMNNRARPERTQQDFLKEALNVDFDDSFGIQGRPGYSMLFPGAIHSLWSDNSRCFYIKDDLLIELLSDSTTQVLKTGLSGKPICFEEVNGEYYFSSEQENGVISGANIRSWGIGRPNPYPLPTLIPGNLLEGFYQVTTTFTDFEGRESGAGLANKIFVPQGYGIRILNIPLKAEHLTNIYCTFCNGEELYRAQTVSPPVNTVDIQDASNLVVQLKSFGMYPPPLSSIVRYAHGRMWVVVGGELYYSEPYGLEWFRLQENFLAFPKEIVGIFPTEGGMWIATDKLYYLAGREIAEARLEEKEPIQVVRGTGKKIPGSHIFIDNTPIGYKWLVTTNKGVCVLFNDGLVLNLTEANVLFPTAESGSSELVQGDGLFKYLTLLKDPVNKMGVGDQITSSIIRNGVILPEV